MKHLLRLLSLALVFAAPLAPITSLHAADLSITASSFLPGKNARYLNGIAGEVITAGQPVVVGAVDGRYYKADANDTTKLKVEGIAAHSVAAAGQAMAIITEDDDLTLGATLSMTAPIYVLSATAGGIAPSADITTGTHTIIIGIAKTTTKIAVKPRVLQSTTPAQ